MRVLLTTLNARFVHTNLALRYLREAIKPEYPDVTLKEFTINDHPEKIAAEIYEQQADVVAFSCYIWNIAETLKVIRRLRPVCPRVRFVLGGPEVSFDGQDLLKCYPEIDAIVAGEGEIPFPQLIRRWQQGLEPVGIPGVIWRRANGEIVTNPPAGTVSALAELPMPYGTEEDFSDRIVYVETTRGCPFNCQYCLSSTFTGVRYLEPERFRNMFRHLLRMGARAIKFVDRTFNANKRHAFQILDIVREEARGIEGVRVHCEMAGDLLDEEWMDYLANYPRGLIQLEIGVQSTHLPTLKLISRVQHFERWRDKVYALQNVYYIPVHLDLIAGLPGEDFRRFGQSFDDVYSAYPNYLQLGFLKVLKGSGVRLRSEEYGLKYIPDPPYTVLETRDLPHRDLLQLMRIEELLESFYNSGRFRTALRYLVELFPSPFAFYDRLARYWQAQGWFNQPVHGKKLFARLWEFVLDLSGEAVVPGGGAATGEGSDQERRRSEQGEFDLEKLRDALRFDYYLWERPAMEPEFLNCPFDSELKGHPVRERIRRDPVWGEVIADFAQLEYRQWVRSTAIACFTHEIAVNPLLTVQEVTLKPEGAEALRKTRLAANPGSERGVSLPGRGFWYLFYYRRPTVVYLVQETGN